MRSLILLALCGAAVAARSHVAGGEPTTIEAYPYLANLQHSYYGGISWLRGCVGSLITERSVLSTATCYFQEPPSSWRVLLGDSQVGSSGNEHTVTAITTHPQYDEETIENDLAIVRLEYAAVLSESIGLARIAGPNYNLPDGTSVAYVGWENLASGGQLQRAELNLINQEICAQRYEDVRDQPGFSSWPDVTDSMLCAGLLDTEGADCEGHTRGPIAQNAGGPVVHNADVIVAVTSWNHACAHAEVGARVSYYSQWIADVGSA